MVRDVVVYGIDIGRHVLGDAEFHEEAPHHEFHAFNEFVAGEFVLVMKQ